LEGVFISCAGLLSCMDEIDCTCSVLVCWDP
jgi:hypothetical protein